MTRRAAAAELAALALPVAVFVLLQTRLLGHQDPLSAGSPELALYAWATVQKDSSLAGDWCGTLFGWPFALLGSAYVGPWEIYFTIPFLWLFRRPEIALYLRGTVFGAVGLIVFYALLRAWSRSARAAFLGALMLAVMPSYLFASVNSLHCSTALMPVSLGAFLCLELWARGGGGAGAWLAAGLGLIGVGLADHPHFLGLLPGYACLLWAHRTQARKKLSAKGGWIWLAAGVLGLAAALAPMIYANATSGWPVRRFLAAHWRYPHHGGAPSDNLDYVGNLRFRVDWELRHWVGTGTTPEFSSPRRLSFPIPPRRNPTPYMFLTGLAGGLALLLRGPRESRVRRPTAVAIAAAVGFLLLSPISPATLGPEHLLLTLPFLCALVVLLPEWFADRRAAAGRGVLAAAVLLHAAAGLTIDRYFERESAAQSSAPALRALQDRLLSAQEPVLIVGPEIALATKLAVFSSTRLRPDFLDAAGLLGARAPGALRGRLVVLCENDSTPERRAFRSVLRRLGWAAAPAGTISDGRGGVAFRLYRVAP